MPLILEFFQPAPLFQFQWFGSGTKTLVNATRTEYTPIAVVIGPRGPKGDTGDTGPAAELVWSTYANNWSETPTQIATIATGAVYQYVWRGVTRYRLVPEPYLSENDAFYSAFSSGVLSSFIVSRG